MLNYTFFFLYIGYSIFDYNAFSLQKFLSLAKINSYILLVYKIFINLLHLFFIFNTQIINILTNLFSNYEYITQNF